MKESHRYDDIIDLPHHVSPTRPHMPLLDRAAQFAPFAALTGYDDAVEETARLTDTQGEPDETELERLNALLLTLQERQKERPEVEVLHFVPDARKSGGAWKTTRGRLKKIDELKGLLCLTDGTVIPFERIGEITACSEPPAASL